MNTLVRGIIVRWRNWLDVSVQIRLTQSGVLYIGSIPILVWTHQIGIIIHTGSNPVLTTKKGIGAITSIFNRTLAAGKTAFFINPLFKSL